MASELAPLGEDTLRHLRRASTATITTQLFKRGLRNAFLYGLGPMNLGATPMVGEAFTLRNIPAREDLDVLSVFEDPDHPQRKAIESVLPGQVLVMDCRGEGRAASAGSILLTRLMQRKAAGCVTDGTLRDTPVIRALSFPVYTAGPCATTNLALHHAVDMQVPIACAGVPVYPGDVIVGDQEGAVCIPREMATEVGHDAAEQEDLENYIAGRIRHGAPLRDVYPPSEQTLAEYERSRRRG